MGRRRVTPPDGFDAVDKIVKMFRDVEQSRREQEVWWARSKRHYEGKDVNKYYNYVSNVFVPWTATVVESQTSRAINNIFSSRPIVAIAPRFGSGDDVLARQLTRYIEYLFGLDDFNFITATEMSVKEAILYGKGFIGMVGRRIYHDGNFIDIPALQWVPVREIYIDPRATTMLDARYILRRYTLTRKEVEKKRKIGWDVPNDLPYGDWPEWYSIHYSDYVDENGVLSWKPPTEEQVEVLEYWARDKMKILLARIHIAKEEDIGLGTNQWPFSDVTYGGLPGTFWGFGVGRMLFGLQEDLNLLRRQRRHNVELVMNARWAYIPEAIRGDLSALEVSRPGALIPVEDTTSIYPLVTPDVTGSSYNEEAALKGDIQNATGEFDFVRGQPPNRGRERATTVVRLQQAALNRFNSFMQIFATRTMRPLVKRMLVFTRMATPIQFYESVTGERDAGFYRMPVDRILNIIDINPLVGQDVSSKDMRLQRIMQALPLLQNNPYIRQDAMLERVLRLLDIEQHRQLIKSEQEVMAQAQAMAQQQGGQQ